jgi:FlaG/FlaF family flagellin (archaellin)
MQWGRIAPVVALVVVLGGTLAGCATETSGSSDGPTDQSSQAGPVQSGFCADYIQLKTPAERRDAADLVVDADVTKTDRTVEPQGIYEVYEATVTDVTKGDAVAPGDTIQVISTSDQCETSGEPVEYLEGDPLADEGTFRLYLSPTDDEDDEVWRLVVPGAAEPAPAR